MSSQAFFNELRNTRSARSLRPIQSARTSNSQQPTLINFQKREKLKQLLVTKFMKKYHLKTNEPFIEEEVKNFLHKETLTDNDLKRLDKKIFEILQKKYSLNQLENYLKGDEVKSPDLQYSPETNDSKYKEELKGTQRIHTAMPNKRDTDAMSVKSGLSGASKLSQAKPKKKELTEDDLELLSVTSHKEPVNRVIFSNEKDEWNAINKYNQQVFEQDKINERFKDKEVKRRTKEDLDNQIKQKMLLQNEERMKTREYDKIAIDHVDEMNKLEAQRKREQKEKMLREKENRDAQRLDEKKRKKVEELKNKKYEKELRKLLMYFILYYI